MYATYSASRQSRTAGVATVVMLHLAVAGALLTIKPPKAMLEVAPMVITLLPELSLPSEPVPLPETPEEISLTETVPLDAVPLPEIMPPEPSTMMASLPTVSDPSESTLSNLTNGAALPSRLKKPPYPRQSERLNEEGISTIEACVTPNGTVSTTRLVESSGYTRLDDAAAKWLKGLRNFKPAMQNGVAVTQCMTIPVEWKIETNR